MEHHALPLERLSDSELLAEVKRRAAAERGATVLLIAALMELDARKLYLGEGCSSLFTYCTQVLHLSEHAAYGRIEAARAARRFPVILDLLAGGDVTLTTVGLLTPLLTPGNCGHVLAAARHKSKREVEALVATLRPQPPVASTIRKLPAPPPSMPASPPAPGAPAAPPERQGAEPTMPVVVATPLRLLETRRPEVKPLAPDIYKIQFTLNKETHDKLRRAQDLLRHQNADGDPAMIFDKALTLLIEHLERVKLAATEKPRSPRPMSATSRHIPASVRRAAWQRDGGRCAFVETTGRCRETGFLEYHHVTPFAAGGEATAENIELRCRAHNVFEAERYFGQRLLFGKNSVRT